MELALSVVERLIGTNSDTTCIVPVTDIKTVHAEINTMNRPRSVNHSKVFQKLELLL